MGSRRGLRVRRSTVPVLVLGEHGTRPPGRRSEHRKRENRTYNVDLGMEKSIGICQGFV